MTTERIRELNDVFRTSFQGGRVMLTAGVNALPADVKLTVIRRVMAFSTFTADNDPDGEHDFGGFEVDGQRIFWKIDLYDPTLEHGSEDPSDPSKTTRVLTIMLASEYRLAAPSPASARGFSYAEVGIVSGPALSTSSALEPQRPVIVMYNYVMRLARNIV